MRDREGKILKINDLKSLNIIIFLFLAFIVGISCFGVFSLHFLNDEWIQLGNIYGSGIFREFTENTSVFEILSGKGRLLGALLNNVFFYIFWDNPIPFAVFAVVFHTLNSFLVYLVTREITGKKIISLITASVFCVPATAHQAISWFAATIQTVGSMTFVLVSVLMAIHGHKRKDIRLLILSWILAYVALLFKESSFFVFPILVILPYFTLPKIKKPFWWIKLFVFFFPFLIKFNFFWQIPKDHIFSSDIFLAFLRSGINFIWYPLVSLGQFFIPFRFMLRFSLIFTRSIYSFMANVSEGNQVVNIIVTDLISVLASFVMIFVLAYIYARRAYLRKSILFAGIWFVLTFGPISVFLYNRNYSYIESRYLYFSFFAIAMMVGIITEEFINIFYSLFKNKAIAWGITIALFSVFLLKQVTLLRREIQQNILYGDDITFIMTEVKKIFPKIPPNPIFFVEGDRTFFLTDTHLPLQLGPGYMLMLAYTPDPSVSKDLLKMNYLDGLTDQGYEEVDGKGYGYFFDKDKLLHLYQSDKDLSVNQIIGMYYFGNDRRLVDTTETIRKYVKTNLNKLN
jgi:hypothetical protein